MSTRGAYGFRIDGVDKVTYNHSDSYPSWLGHYIARFIKNTTDGKLEEIAERIELVDEDIPPTPEQIEKLKTFANTGVSAGRMDEWYVLLRDAQGNLDVYRETDLNVMIDSHTFLQDSLFCEWAYIINVDEMTLEIYKGYNKSPDGEGRYAKFSTKFDAIGETYYGVKLARSFPISELRKMAATLPEKMYEEAVFAGLDD